MRCHVSVPATSANLGVGFDCLGMALDLRAYFDFESSDALCIDGCDERYRGDDNLVWQSYLTATHQLDVEPMPLHITINSPIPLSGGLGSSSACVVAGIAAAQVIHGWAIDPYLSLKLATSIEGHPDNVAPAILGGVVSSFMRNGEVISVSDPVCKRLRFVAIAPPVEVRTDSARDMVPTVISLETAVWQMGRCVATVDALRLGQLNLLKQACEDKLHEPYRKKLIPCYDAVRTTALDAGAHAFFISGSGSTMIAACNSFKEANNVARAAQTKHPDAWVRVLKASAAGVRANYASTAAEYTG